MSCSTCLRIRTKLVSAIKTVLGVRVLDTHRSSYVTNVCTVTYQFFDGLVSAEHCHMVFSVSDQEYRHYFKENLLDILPEEVRTYHMKGYNK